MSLRLNNLMSLVEAAPDDVLMMSLRHCHCTGVHSIVTKKGHGRLVRFFLADRTHHLWRNSPYNDNWSVGVHNHRYDIVLWHVYGRVFNESYCDTSPLLNYEDEKRYTGKRYDCYAFNSAISNGASVEDAKPRKIGSAFLAHLASTEIDCAYHMAHTDLHTIRVPHGEPAAWLVCEGDQKLNTTTLFTNRRPDMGGMYQKFKSPREVREFVDKFCSAGVAQ